MRRRVPRPNVSSRIARSRRARRRPFSKRAGRGARRAGERRSHPAFRIRSLSGGRPRTLGAVEFVIALLVCAVAVGVVAGLWRKRKQEAWRRAYLEDDT